jgi:hypothetical protein
MSKDLQEAAYKALSALKRIKTYGFYLSVQGKRTAPV